MKNTLSTGALLAPVLLLSACGAGQKDVKQKPLNIIHIMTDDHSYQTISAYGHPISQLAPTPNLDRLAAEGMLFRQAFVENSLSTPSRACLMTGLYSHQNGQRQLGAGIDTTKTFFSEILQQHGYQTGVVGKWHMQCEPKGFDYYHVLLDQGDYYNPAFKSRHSKGEYIKEEGYATTLTTDHAIEFLEERDADKPFCLLVHHKAPHRNWMPETKYMDLYEDVEFPYPATFNDNYATRCAAAPTQEMRIDNDMTLIYDLKVDELKTQQAYKNEWNIRGWDASLDRMTPEQRDAWVASYGPRNQKFIDQNLKDEELVKWKYQRYLKDYLRCIKTIDDEVGRLIAYLEKEGLMDNTVIIYTSDQGFYMGEHGWFDKRFMYEESMRTPLLMRLPESLKKRGDIPQLVQNIDYAPTLLDIAGAPIPEDMQGVSILPLLKGRKPAEWRKSLYYHYTEFPGEHFVRRHYGVRTDRYKLIHFYNDIDSWELYDLKKDPMEMHNEYNNPKYAKTVKQLHDEIIRLQVQYDDPIRESRK